MALVTLWGGEEGGVDGQVSLKTLTVIFVAILLSFLLLLKF